MSVIWYTHVWIRIQFDRKQNEQINKKNNFLLIYSVLVIYIFGIENKTDSEIAPDSELSKQNWLYQQRFADLY